jgi:uncharacterized membrane protein
MIDQDVLKVIFLVLISAMAYALPMVWIKGTTPMTSCITSLFSLITIGIYALLIKGHRLGEIEGQRFKRLMLTGIIYGIGLICYIEATKYNKISLLSLQTIGIFVISSMIAFMVFGEESSKTKWMGILVVIIGALMLING